MQTRPELGLYILRALLASVAAVLLLVACSDDAQQAQPLVVEKLLQPRPSAFEILNPELNSAATAIAADYAEQIEVDFDRIAVQIEQMRSAIDALIDQPSEANLAASQQSWLAAHSAYELSTVHRYFIAQLLIDQDRLEFLQLQYQINHWPIVPGYIDYVEGYPDSGIVHDINVGLDNAGIRAQNGTFDISEVVLGFHAIEFLLWGYDIESGRRPASDYLAIRDLSPEQAENGFSLDQVSNNRRRALLVLVTEALSDDFRSLQSLWLTQMNEIAQRIEAMTGSESIVVIADAMTAMLTEELLLRSLYPMLNGELHESIQSPFSLSTQIAVSTQLSGLESLLLERQTESGTTLDLIFSAVSNEFSEFFYQNFDASKSCLVLLYSNLDNQTPRPGSQGEVEIVECINLLTNMVGHLERLKFELTN